MMLNSLMYIGMYNQFSICIARLSTGPNFPDFFIFEATIYFPNFGIGKIFFSNT